MHRPLALLLTSVLLAGCSHLAAPATAALPAARSAGALSQRVDHVRGIGGLFFRSANPTAQYDWYTKHLDLAAKPNEGTWFFWQLPGNAAGFSTMWFIFPASTTYFNGPCMINYVVDNLDAMLERLKAEGVRVAPKTLSDAGGKFGWAYDADGNKIELFEPLIHAAPVPHGHVLGIGGISLKSANQLAQYSWYAEHLGIAAKPNEGKRFQWELPGNPPTKLSTTWDVYPATTDHFNGPCMINYLVDDLQAVVERLKAEGVQVDPKAGADARGKLAWAFDGDGNKFELLEPAGH
ncbi:MAG: hypothetical protein JWM80_2454 [Cyanobacteria bacterium RYN_339]|nr:hypothetical protein [Cyanobacteria bacterium RYN_339]